MNYLFDDNENIVSYLDKVYPVGSIYMSTNATSPATLFGGEWKALDEGRVLIGANSTYPVNSTGGEFEHTLTIDEMPRHNHSIITYWTHDGSGQTYDQWYGNAAGTTGMTGGSQPHNNMQPYLAVYMWERTA